MSDSQSLQNQLRNSVHGDYDAVAIRLDTLRNEWNPYQQIHSTPTFVSSVGKKSTRRKSATRKTDYYTVLKLHPRASVDQIKQSFRKLALVHHPDKCKHLPNDDEEEEARRTFHQIQQAYTVLSNEKERRQYDAHLEDWEGNEDLDMTKEKEAKTSTLEGGDVFTSLEWMKRIKDKLDVLQHLHRWSKLLEIPYTHLRFETGPPCLGKGCGKIVSMDKDLECLQSSRRRVYICLLHNYVHACDHLCTQHGGIHASAKESFDQRICAMRGYWLAQNWVYEATLGPSSHLISLLGSNTELAFNTSAKGPDNRCCGLEDSSTCRYISLEEGIWICQVHGYPHICTFEQCHEVKLDNTHRYVCPISHRLYGHASEPTGVETRKRKLVYQDRWGQDTATEMDVPIFLPVGKSTEVLLINSIQAQDKSPERSPKDEPKVVAKTKGPKFNPAAAVKQRLHEKIDPSTLAEVYTIHIALPAAIATLPVVSLELDPKSGFLPLSMSSKATIGQIKARIEEFSEVAPFDQQLLWDGAVLGEGVENETTSLLDYGLVSGVCLTLQLHQDNPYEVSTWNPSRASGQCTTAGTTEYNTVLISKEAEEDVLEQQEEYDREIKTEEQRFADHDHQYKRRKLLQRGILDQIEVVDFSSPVPQLLGLEKDNNK